MGAAKRWWSTPRTGYVAVVIVALVVLCAELVAGSVASAAAADHRGCRVPKLDGLTVRVARARAARAHCSVRLRGAKVKRADVQIVAGQSPSARLGGRTITLRVEPLCEGVPEQEPVSKPGPTELITGLFNHFEGTPRPGVTPHHTTGFWSEPECHIVDAPVAGSVTVTNEAGIVVALEPLAEGQLATIPLPPGRYTILGTFAQGREEGEKPAHSDPTPVTIPAGVSVRQDVHPKGPNA